MEAPLRVEPVSQVASFKALSISGPHQSYPSRLCLLYPMEITILFLPPSSHLSSIASSQMVVTTTAVTTTHSHAHSIRLKTLNTLMLPLPISSALDIKLISRNRRLNCIRTCTNSWIPIRLAWCGNNPNISRALMGATRRQTTTTRLASICLYLRLAARTRAAYIRPSTEIVIYNSPIHSLQSFEIRAYDSSELNLMWYSGSSNRTWWKFFPLPPPSVPYVNYFLYLFSQPASQLLLYSWAI